jgi:hypothetical protein
MQSDRENLQISELICRVLEGQASAAEIRQLEELLQHNSEVLSFYTQISDTLAELMCPGHSMHISYQADLDSEQGLDMHLWKLLAEEEKVASTVEISEPVSDERPVIVKVKPMSRSLRMNKFSVVSLITSAAALLFLVLFAQFGPSRPMPVATVTDSFEARWQNRSPEVGSRLTNRRSPLRLLSGYAKLQFDNGAEVIMQGPCDFQLDNAEQMQLNYGKLTALIRPEAVGFRVNTSVMSVVDLGTEFSVRVDEEGGVVNLYNGRASVLAGREGERKGSQLMTEGQAMRVDSETQRIEEVSLDDRSFVRRLDSKRGFLWRGESINLADIVGGGNGFGTGTPDSGIETNTGRRFRSPDPALVQSKISGILTGGGSYNKVSDLPFIDGVFVPDSRQGQVQITSAGHTFDGFVDGREVFWGNIFNGAWHASDQMLKHSLKLNGQAYGTPDNPAISIHANQGITFDLQAIRQAIPGGRILRFTSLFGVSETVALAPTFDPQSSLNSGKVNCWVLIDGKERFSRNAVSYLHGAIEIEVDIRDADRFLTLVVTESNDRRAFDWALFARPLLQIEMDMN